MNDARDSYVRDSKFSGNSMNRKNRLRSVMLAVYKLLHVILIKR